MLKQDISTDEVYEMLQRLEQVVSIAKTSRYGLQSSYTKPLESEDLEHVFSGIESILEPMKNKLYDVHEAR